jgi:hypothetical protein
MSTIPLHLQRKFEQRWAARFVSSLASIAPKSADLNGTVNDLPRPAKAKKQKDTRRNYEEALTTSVSPSRQTSTTQPIQDYLFVARKRVGIRASREYAPTARRFKPVV